jgi:hypothetical protein
MKRRVPVILFVFFFILIVVIVVYHNSYSIALKKAGFSQRSISYIDTGIDDNGNDYRVVFRYDTDNMVRIALLTKDNWGVWHITDEVIGPDAEADYITMGWMRFASMRRYDVTDQTVMDSEVHKVYGGNNATKQIEIPMDLIPPNVSVNVFQAGSVYVIHFVSYGDADSLNQIDMIDLLKQTDCIQ